MNVLAALVLGLLIGWSAEASVLGAFYFIEPIN